MSGLLSFSVRHPRAVVALSLLLALAAGLAVPRIELRLDGRSLIPADHPSMRASDAAAARFGGRDIVVMAVVDRERGIYHGETLAVLERLGSGLEAIEGVVPSSVSSLATAPRLYVAGDVLDLRPLLAAKAELDPAGVRRLRRETRAQGLDDGLLVSADGRAAGIYAEVAADADRDHVRRRVAELADGARQHGVEVVYSGTALAQAVLGEAAARDLATLVPLVLAAVAVVLVAVFRHPVPAIVSLAEVGVSLLATLGVMGAVRQEVFITTLALPVVLVVIGISDDVYALNRYFTEAARHPGRSPGRVVVTALTAVRRPILVTAATTMLGLLCLTATRLEPPRVFGLYGALSVLFSTVLTFSLVPALLVLLRPAVPPTGAPALAWSRRATLGLLDRLLAFGPRRVVASAALLAVASLAATGALRIGDNWIGNLPASSEIVRGDRVINELMAGTNTLDLLVDTGRPRGLVEPSALLALGALEERLAGSRDVGAVEGAFAQVARVDAALQGVDYRRHRRRLLAGEVELDESRIEQALLLLGSLRDSPLVERLDAAHRRARITVLIRSADYRRVERLLEVARRAEAEAAGAWRLVPFGDGWIGYQTIRLLVRGQILSIGLAVLFDTVVLTLLLGSLGLALIAVAPVVVGVLAVFALLAAAGLPLGTANSMFAAIALGIGVDYSIHLVAHHRQHLRRGGSATASLRRALAATGPAILVSALAMALGFSTLLASEVRPNRELGGLVALSMMVCAISTIMLVPCLLSLRGGER